jgi:hypothetical protein
MWMWNPRLSPGRHWTFDVSDRIRIGSSEFAPYDGDSTAFEHAASAFAAAAVTEIVRLRSGFSSVASVAHYYQSQTPSMGWPEYHRSVALGLLGSNAQATAGFRHISLQAAGSDIEWTVLLGHHADSLAQLVEDQRAFKAAIETQIAVCRESLGLPRLTPPVIRI